MANHRSRMVDLLCTMLPALVLACLSSVAMAQATVTLDMVDDQASEAGPATASFNVTRTGPTGSPLDVWLNGSGTAAWGADWTGSGGAFFASSITSFRITIPTGASSVSVTILPKQDNRLEGQETFAFSIATNAAYVVGSPSSDSFFLEDDVAEVTIEMTDDIATEAGPTPATLVVRRTNNGLMSDSLTVRLSGSGTATWGSDWAGAGGEFLFFRSVRSG